MKKVHIVFNKSNPHCWSSGEGSIVAIWETLEEAQACYDAYPHLHYVNGQSKPHRILEIKTIPLGELTSSGKIWVAVG